MDIFVTQNLDSSVYEDSLNIRKIVFVQEQKVPTHIEMDDLDLHTIHYVGYIDDIAVSTMRVCPMDNGALKFQRLATLPEYRGNGYAEQLIDRALADAKEKGMHQIVLSAQTQVIPYYEKLGFKVTSDEFIQANIPHKMMQKFLL